MSYIIIKQTRRNGHKITFYRQNDRYYVTDYINGPFGMVDLAAENDWEGYSFPRAFTNLGAAAKFMRRCIMSATAPV